MIAFLPADAEILMPTGVAGAHLVRALMRSAAVEGVDAVGRWRSVARGGPHTGRGYAVIDLRQAASAVRRWNSDDDPKAARSNSSGPSPVRDWAPPCVLHKCGDGLRPKNSTMRFAPPTVESCSESVPSSSSARMIWSGI